MKVTNLYTKMEKTLNSLKENKLNFASFCSLAKEICDLIENDGVSYSDLTNKGELFQHSVNVAILSGELGIIYNINDIYNLVLGSLTHDLGKLYINQSILNKNGKLSDIEKIIVAEHANIGYKVIRYFTENEIVSDIVLKHHTVFNDISPNTDIRELKDKEKYPLICGIADVTDAVLSHRPYKKPLPKEVLFIDLNEKGLIGYYDNLNSLIGEIA